LCVFTPSGRIASATSCLIYDVQRDVTAIDCKCKCVLFADVSLERGTHNVFRHLEGDDGEEDSMPTRRRMRPSIDSRVSEGKRGLRRDNVASAANGTKRLAGSNGCGSVSLYVAHTAVGCRVSAGEYTARGGDEEGERGS
jgi:hypothetical protein